MREEGGEIGPKNGGDRPRRTGLAAVWMVGALASFSTMAVAGREITQTISTFELMFFRSCLGLLIIVTLILIKQLWFQGEGLRSLKTRKAGLHLVRNSVHFLGQFGWFFAITLIPLAEVIALEFTAPIWVALLAPLLLGERMTVTRVIAVICGFVGILIIVQPWSLRISEGSAWALTAAIGFAFNFIATKRLSSTEAPTTILFYMVLMQAPMGLIGAYQGLSWPDSTLWLWLILVSVAGLTAHFCLSTAISLADAVVVAPLDFLRLPLLAMLGLILYDEPLQLFVFVGASIILTGIWINLRRETKRA